MRACVTLYLGHRNNDDLETHVTILLLWIKAPIAQDNDDNIQVFFSYSKFSFSKSGNKYFFSRVIFNCSSHFQGDGRYFDKAGHSVKVMKNKQTLVF